MSERNQLFREIKTKEKSKMKKNNVVELVDPELMPKAIMQNPKYSTGKILSFNVSRNYLLALARKIRFKFSKDQGHS